MGAKSTSLRTLILCGGKGTRAYPHTLEVPKALLDVAGRPLIAHVLELYASQGFADFVLAAGYRHELLTDYAAGVPGDWSVTVVDTGLDTGTGARISACREQLGRRFFATYADGLADVDLAALLEFHDRHGRLATLTTVPLPSQYGTLDLDADGAVRRFQEKPVLRDHWINAGFFVLDEGVFDHWAGEDLERDVLPALAAAGELRAYRHDGFWKSLDTYKDALELSRLGAEGRSPWTRSPAHASS